VIPTTLSETVTKAMGMVWSAARTPWAIDPERRAKLLDLLEMQLRRAEKAEAYAAWMVEHAPDTVTWGDYRCGEGLLREYITAREAVRKLEEGT
jgi:hypothetical protein